MELLPPESMQVIVVLATLTRVFLTNVQPQKLTMPSPLLDMDLKVENLIGWLRIPGETTGEMKVMSRSCEEKQLAELHKIVPWLNVPNQDTLHQPHKLHLQPQFQQIKFAILANCTITPTLPEPIHWPQLVCIWDLKNLLTWLTQETVCQIKPAFHSMLFTLTSLRSNLMYKMCE